MTKINKIINVPLDGSDIPSSIEQMIEKNIPIESFHFNLDSDVGEFLFSTGLNEREQKCVKTVLDNVVVEGWEMVYTEGIL